MRGKRFGVLKAAFLIVAASILGSMAYAIATFPDFNALKNRTPRESAIMRLRDDQAKSRGRKPMRFQIIVPLQAISPNLRHAVLMAEDSGFYRHHGVDWEALRSAAREDLKRRKWSRGGSTITQQLVKNLYLSPAKNPFRKLHEMLLAAAMERSLPKSRILELYLNVVEWGPGIYGAEAASRAYFYHPASELNPYQAATLAGMLINPRRYAPEKESPRLARRRAIILARMVHAGYITEDEYLEATAPSGGLTDFLRRLFKGEENPPLEEEDNGEAEAPDALSPFAPPESPTPVPMAP